MTQGIQEPIIIQTCRAVNGCPKSLGELDKLREALEKAVSAAGFKTKRKEALQGKIKNHQVFKVCLAGCPNCCSQPQIKEFGVYAAAYPEINQDKCTLCSACVRACREGALDIENERIKIKRESCIGCGDCFNACPSQAIEKKREGWKIIAGGKLGRHPQLAKDVKEAASINEVPYYLQKALNIMLDVNNPNLRFGDIIDDYLERVK
ncbi:MAG: 4Fe-4S binding protein [Desulfotomaculum sp.]|nr:4Fe-4S binding protein [Desulfotomaculum sp.]